MKIRLISRAIALKVACAAPFVMVVLFTVMVGSAQAPSGGVVRPLAGAKFAADDDLKCLSSVLENGDPATGASTILLKAAPGCVVPPHFHTAEEQLIAVRGEVSTGMEGMSATVLGPGGFAMMPGKKTHWFTCVSKTECLMFVTFDQKYDITWVKQK
jgi:quercetin dioxygenase-like cupin family protein